MSEWHQVWVHGSEKTLRAFVAARLRLPEGAPPVLFGADLDIEPTSLGARLRELLGSPSHHLVLAEHETAKALVEAIEKHGDASGLRLYSHGRVRAARFDFEARAYSPAAAEEIQRAMLHGLAPGVRLENVNEREERDPSARGPELYAPEHDYTYRLAARASGDVPGIFALHRLAHGMELVSAGRVHLFPDLSNDEAP
jgi:hypothetical protein